MTSITLLLLAAFATSSWQHYAAPPSAPAYIPAPSTNFSRNTKFRLCCVLQQVDCPCPTAGAAGYSSPPANPSSPGTPGTYHQSIQLPVVNPVPGGAPAPGSVQPQPQPGSSGPVPGPAQPGLPQPSPVQNPIAIPTSNTGYNPGPSGPNSYAVAPGPNPGPSSPVPGPLPAPGPQPLPGPAPLPNPFPFPFPQIPINPSGRYVIPPQPTPTRPCNRIPLPVPCRWPNPGPVAPGCSNPCTQPPVVPVPPTPLSTPTPSFPDKYPTPSYSVPPQPSPPAPQPTVGPIPPQPLSTPSPVPGPTVPPFTINVGCCMVAITGNQGEILCGCNSLDSASIHNCASEAGKATCSAVHPFTIMSRGNSYSANRKITCNEAVYQGLITLEDLKKCPTPSVGKSSSQVVVFGSSLILLAGSVMFYVLF